MTTVFNTLTSADGRPLQNQTVRISLMAPGNPFTAMQSEVIQAHAVDTSTTGRWQAELIPNADYEREGTWYRVDQRDSILGVDYVHDIVVPATGGPYWVRDLIVIPPAPGEPFPPVPPHALGDHTDVDTTGALPGQVLKFDGAEWRPAADSGGGGGGGGSYVHFQNIAAQVVTVPHNLGMYPAGVRLFNAEQTVEYDEFRVSYVDANNLTVDSAPALFRGYVYVS